MAALAIASSRTILLQAAAAGISPGFRYVLPMKLSPLGLTRPPLCACKRQQCMHVVCTALVNMAGRMLPYQT